MRDIDLLAFDLVLAFPVRGARHSFHRVVNFRGRRVITKFFQNQHEENAHLTYLWIQVYSYIVGAQLSVWQRRLLFDC